MAYKIADYIQLNNTYFVTNAGLKTNTSIYTKFSPVELNNENNFLFGDNFGNATFCLNAHSSGYFRIYSGSYVNDNFCNFTLSHLYELELTTTSATIRDLTTTDDYNVTYGNSVSETLNGMFIGSLNGFNQPIKKENLYEFIIYEGGVEVAHFLPYGDTETGYGVLYDTVSGNYLTANEPSKTTAFFPQFSIEPENISFDYTGGTSALTITSEKGWTASTENDWLTLSSTTGTGDSEITVTAQLNKGQERTGIITVTNGNTNVSCTITQSKYPVLLYCENLFKNGNTINKIYKGNVVLRENLFMFNVDINEIEFEKSGGTQQAVINSTKKWTASAPNWITLSSYSGRSGNITITAASADTSRDGNIVIDNGVNQKIITVNQTVVRYELDLNNGEWIANGEVEGYTLYESTNNGKTSTTYSCYLKFTGQSATLMVQTDGEEYYDYVVIEDFNTGSSFWSGRGKTHNMYHTVVCNYDTSGVHTIKIKYTKDGSGNYYTDKGYFYIKEIA